MRFNQNPQSPHRLESQRETFDLRAQVLPAFWVPGQLLAQPHTGCQSETIRFPPDLTQAIMMGISKKNKAIYFVSTERADARGWFPALGDSKSFLASSAFSVWQQGWTTQKMCTAVGNRKASTLILYDQTSSHSLVLKTCFLKLQSVFSYAECLYSLPYFFFMSDAFSQQLIHKVKFIVNISMETYSVLRWKESLHSNLLISGKTFSKKARELGPTGTFFPSTQLSLIGMSIKDHI